MVIGVTYILAGDNGYAVLVAGQDQSDVRILLDHVVIDHHAIVGEVGVASIRAIGWLKVGVGKHDGIALWVLFEHLIGPGCLFFSDVIAQVQGDEVHSVGSKEVIVVVVIALGIRVIRSIFLGPIALALLCFVAFWAEILVVQVARTNIFTTDVVVVAR